MLGCGWEILESPQSDRGGSARVFELLMSNSIREPVHVGLGRSIKICQRRSQWCGRVSSNLAIVRAARDRWCAFAHRVVSALTVARHALDGRLSTSSTGHESGDHTSVEFEQTNIAC